MPAKLPLFDGGNRTASNFYPPMGGAAGPGEYGLERTISIRGSSLEKLAKAEELVFAKLRESWQKDFTILSSVRLPCIFLISFTKDSHCRV